MEQFTDFSMGQRRESMKNDAARVVTKVQSIQRISSISAAFSKAVEGIKMLSVLPGRLLRIQEQQVSFQESISQRLVRPCYFPNAWHKKMLDKQQPYWPNIVHLPLHLRLILIHQIHFQHPPPTFFSQK